MGQQIYVEALVRGDPELLWSRTQDASSHTRWDLRFSSITDVVPETAQAPRAFRYALTLPGRTIAGTGTSIGEKVRPDGTRTSALRFGSPDPLSLIRRGSGWWRYVPAERGTRFLTGYDYEPGWGRFGQIVDRLVFRRLLGWMTAWSFDRLRLWVDEDVTPEQSLRRGLCDAGLRAAWVAVMLGSRRRMVNALALAALLAPALPGAPRASRCLRTPPDTVARRPPATLAGLREPEA